MWSSQISWEFPVLLKTSAQEQDDSSVPSLQSPIWSHLSESGTHWNTLISRTIDGYFAWINCCLMWTYFEQVNWSAVHTAGVVGGNGVVVKIGANVEISVEMIGAWLVDDKSFALPQLTSSSAFRQSTISSHIKSGDKQTPVPRWQIIPLQICLGVLIGWSLFPSKTFRVLT
jgi:hypothetical protein